MQATSGNLAYKVYRGNNSKNSTLRQPVRISQHVNSSGSKPVFSRPKNLKVRRISLQETDVRQNLARQKARSINRQLAHRRFLTLLGIVSVIAVISAVYGLVVYRQAMILEANFANLKIERSIEKMNQENSQIREALAQKTNLDQIRRLAIDELGLQDPAMSQVVNVYVPDTDRVVYAASNMGIAEQDAYLGNVFSNVEGFFKTVNQQSNLD
jgi:hypothetical protein